MATFPSKQEKRQGLVDPLLVLASIVLIGVLITFGPHNGSVYRSIDSALVTQRGAADAAHLNVGASFASDLQYWNAECSRGWTSESACDALVSRTQSCVIGTGSVYCSEYDTYLQQFRGK